MYDWSTLERYMREVSFSLLRSRILGDIPAKVVVAYTEGKFLLLDVQYDSLGHRALYEINLETGVIVLAQD